MQSQRRTAMAASAPRTQLPHHCRIQKGASKALAIYVQTLRTVSGRCRVAWQNHVMTNLPFAFLGILGIIEVRKATEKELRYMELVLFWGFVLLTFGIRYYYLWPSNDTLPGV